MALGYSGRDQAFLQTFGTPPPTIAPNVGFTGMGYTSMDPHPNQNAANAALGVPLYYIGINPELYKSYVGVPTNQGQRGGIAARQSMMFDPRNSPSRSQKSEGYTIPVQTFRSTNPWQTPTNQNTAAAVRSQPSTKFASPFSTDPIPTRMPWDL